MKINKIPLILLQCRSKLCIGILLIQGVTTEICIAHAEVQLEQDYEVMSLAPPINSLCSEPGSQSGIGLLGLDIPGISFTYIPSPVSIQNISSLSHSPGLASLSGHIRLDSKHSDFFFSQS